MVGKATIPMASFWHIFLREANTVHGPAILCGDDFGWCGTVVGVRHWCIERRDVNGTAASRAQDVPAGLFVPNPHVLAAGADESDGHGRSSFYGGFQASGTMHPSASLPRLPCAASIRVK